MNFEAHLYISMNVFCSRTMVLEQDLKVFSEYIVDIQWETCVAWFKAILLLIIQIYHMSSYTNIIKNGLIKNN